MVLRESWLDTLARHRWYAATGAGACAAAVVGGVVIFVPHSAAPRPRPVAANCGIVTCTATIPPPATASPLPSPPPPRPTAAPDVTLSPTSSARPAATASRRPSPAPAHEVASVTVTYSVVERWDGGLQGQFTIVNHAGSALSGWRISAAFPGDKIDTAWGATAQISGGTLVLDAPSYQKTIPAGASQSVDFTANGNTTHPATCTLDGATCQ